MYPKEKRVAISKENTLTLNGLISFSKQRTSTFWTCRIKALLILVYLSYWFKDSWLMRLIQIVSLLFMYFEHILNFCFAAFLHCLIFLWL